MAGPRAANDALNRIRRFYKTVGVSERDGAFEIDLDGRSLKTPAKNALRLPTQAAARIVAEEWEAQGEHIDFAAMPATRHAYTATDRVSVTRDEVAREVARYAGSDLLCYFADGPLMLLERQTAAWGPLLDWAHEAEGLAFIRASGISYQPQPPQTLEKVEALARALDDYRLSALAFGGALMGSTILGLALLRGRLTADEAYDLSRLDEAFQQEQWGVDEEAAERTANQREEARALAAWLAALNG